MSDYTQEVYDYVSSLGKVGDVVKTAIHPWLMETYGLNRAEARAARGHAMKELKRRGLVERINVRSRALRILG